MMPSQLKTNMKYRVLILAACFTAFPYTVVADPFQAGTATVDITPPIRILKELSGQ